MIRKISQPSAPRMIGWQKKPCTGEVQHEGGTTEHPSQFRARKLTHQWDWAWAPEISRRSRPYWPCHTQAAALSQETPHFPWGGSSPTAIQGHSPCDTNGMQAGKCSWRKGFLRGRSEGKRVCQPKGSRTRFSLPCGSAGVHCVLAHGLWPNPYLSPLPGSIYAFT